MISKADEAESRARHMTRLLKAPMTIATITIKQHYWIILYIVHISV